MSPGRRNQVAETVVAVGDPLAAGREFRGEPVRPASSEAAVGGGDRAQSKASR